MRNTSTEQHDHERPAAESTQEARRPYWTRAHHDWRFWVVLILMITGMVVYIGSQDLSMGPKGQKRVPVPENTVVP